MTGELLIKHLADLVRDPIFQILMWLIVIDIFSGYAKAYKLDLLDSSIGTNGLIRHALVVFIQAIVGVYSKALDVEYASVGLCLFFISNYALSVLENADAIGLKLPKSLTKQFNRMRDDYDEKLLEIRTKEKKNKDKSEGD